MKIILAKLQTAAVPTLLSIALILTGIFSIECIGKLQGDARVINYTGIVRGATQRLIKKELNRLPDDELIKELDGILYGLANGSEELRLRKLTSPEFQSMLVEMEDEWKELKSAITSFRNGESENNLFVLSEDYFRLANQAVMAAEVFTEKSVQHAKQVLLYMNLSFVFLAIISGIYAFTQKRKESRLRQAEEENRKKSEQLYKMFQALLTPMNEISELLYVSDIETYELLFVNNAGKETFHINDSEKVKCYQALQGFDAPCSFCTIPFTKKDENYTWEYTNPLTGRHYLLKDRMIEWEGRMARMEIAFDMTDAENEKLELKKRLDSDKVLVECLQELYSNHDVKEATNYVLERAGKLFSAERAYVFRIHGDFFSNTAEWCKEGITPQIDSLQNVPQREYQLWLKLFKSQENVIIYDVEELKGTMHSGYEILARQNVSNVVLVPLDRNGELNGLIGLDNPQKDLMESAAVFIQTLRFFLMLAIRRKEDEETLSRLSYQDTLTSFYNRNRYIQDIGQLSGSANPTGIVFLDVNGLKEINDEFGHDAGDRALKECASNIRDTFKIGSFYRIGGDEFVILCSNISEKDFLGKVEELKQCFEDEQTCKAAIGSQWIENCSQIQEAIAAADEKMYADKRAFYHKHRPSGRYRHRND